MYYNDSDRICYPCNISDCLECMDIIYFRVCVVCAPGFILNITDRFCYNTSNISPPFPMSTVIPVTLTMQMYFGDLKDKSIYVDMIFS